MISQPNDVVIVGAGPTGLLLAGDLAAAGVRTTVLERRSEESNLTRAFAVHARTLEQLDARGLADELITTGARVPALRLFGGVRVDLSTLPSRHPFVLITPQYQVERLLQRRAVAAGAHLVRGAEVTGLRQDADGVDLDVSTEDGPVTVRASYVVGADGLRSRVRAALGLPFPGRAVVTSLMLADVRLAEPPRDVIMVNAVGDAFAFIASFGDGWYRVFAWNRRNQQPDSVPVDFAELREVTRRALGTDFGMHDPRWMSRFHSDERQAPRYRVGRVFLAGDAAHVHSPAGGQGMNTGLQDAANLGWKLAAAVHGWAADGLLDTYHAERHPVGRMVLRGSGTILRLALIRSRPAQAARTAVLRTALRLGPVRRRMAGAISGVGIRYAAPRGAHPLVGTRAGDLPLVGDPPVGRLAEALRGGTFVLLAPAGADAATAQAWGDRVRVATPAVAGTPLTLVRPDGYVAWVSEETEPGRRAEQLRVALGEWCGAPVASRKSAATRPRAGQE